MISRVAQVAVRQHHVLRQVAQQPARKCSTMNIAGDKKLSDWDKRIMVWGGAFKNRAEVPTEVPHNMYQKCQERFRIKMNIWAMTITLGACGAAIFLGQMKTDDDIHQLDNQDMQSHADLHRELHSGGQKPQQQ